MVDPNHPRLLDGDHVLSFGHSWRWRKKGQPAKRLMIHRQYRQYSYVYTRLRIRLPSLVTHGIAYWGGERRKRGERVPRKEAERNGDSSSRISAFSALGENCARVCHITYVNDAQIRCCKHRSHTFSISSSCAAMIYWLFRLSYGSFSSY